MLVIDLSHPLVPGLPVYPGTDAPKFAEAATLETRGFCETRFTLASHMGTHCDAPAHLVAGGATLDSLPAGTWIGQGRRIDLREVCRESGGKIGPEHLRPFLPARCDWLLLQTGWEERWGAEDYFTAHPELTPAGAELLAGTGVTGIGLDTPSPERPTAEGLPAHHILFRAGALIVENLRNLEALPESGFTFICAPLPLAEADGAPCRCLAQVLRRIS